MSARDRLESMWQGITRTEEEVDEFDYVLGAAEFEAVDRYRVALRAAVEVLPQPTLGLKGGVDRASVLALIDALEAETP